jgi:hypothetical protein
MIAPPEVEARRSAQLKWLSSSALVPWMVLTLVTVMALATPNIIITPIMWLMLTTVWSYPLVIVGSRAVAALFQRYGWQHKATQALVIPASIGAFQFSMLVAPLALFPVFSDGYFALMGSCLLSIAVAGAIVRWILR